jgi:exopolysaccharide biosynthesis polyprenyl glycosylphosphotransferase
MNKSRQTLKYIISDFLSALLAWLLFNLLRYDEVGIYQGYHSLEQFLLDSHVLQGWALIPVGWLILFYFSGYYNKPFGKSRLTEFLSTALTVIIGVVIVFFAVLLNDLPHSFVIYYKLFFVLLGLQFVLTYVPRLLITLSGIAKIKNREWALRILIIGSGSKAKKVARSLYSMGYDIVGTVNEDESSQVASFMEKTSVDELVVAIESHDNERRLQILYSLYHYNLPIKVLVDKANMISGVKVKTLIGVPLVDVTDNNFSEAEKNIKRTLDYVFSAFAVLFLTPLFLYIAFRVKKDSPGPVLFKQERIGYMGKPFYIYKFRTMVPNADAVLEELLKKDKALAKEYKINKKLKRDPRITKIGKIIRKTSIDELPQILNILKSDMALIGNRPYLPREIEDMGEYYEDIIKTKPGLTGYWQVSGRNNVTFEHRLQLEKYYSNNCSLIFDLKIFFKTFIVVLKCIGSE